MKYSVEYTPAAFRMLRKLPRQVVPAVHRVVESLADNPRPHGCRKLADTDLWRVRVGSYRVVYQIHDEVLLVLVITIGHRREVYR